MGEKEVELLERIHKRLGWILFWIIILGLAIASNIDSLTQIIK